MFERLNGFEPRVVNGVVELPVYHMRGGTSTGVVLWSEHLPADLGLREEAIRRIMGAPAEGELPGNKQTTGLGRGPSTSNKVFIVDRASNDEADLASTLAQVTADKASIDWSVNCGNMSAALPMYALDTGLFEPAVGTTTIRIFNTNTSVITDATVQTPDGTAFIPPDTEIPGVMGRFPGVALSLRRPVGAKTGRLLPTGHASDRFAGVEVSCLDVAMPVVFARAAEFGKSGHESVDELGRDGALKERMREVWVEAGLAMGLKKAGGEPMTADDLAHSETQPKFCLVAEPTGNEHIVARYFTPQSAHNSLAVTGGCCLAVACLVPGTVPRQVARNLPTLGATEQAVTIAMRNPAGVLRARISAAETPDGIAIGSVAYERSAQVFLRGHFPLYEASPELRRWAEGWSKARSA